MSSAAGLENSKTDEDPFRPLTQRVFALRNVVARKATGQYFTPRALRSKLLDKLSIAPGMKVLDPGAGTGEFLLDVLERCPGAIVEGYEFDEEIVALTNEAHPEANVRGVDLLGIRPEPKYDLVIGNPPYYEFKLDADSRERFSDVISGRPNVFAVFFHVGLELLKDGGRLAFVAPPSMNNGAYFEKLRRHILGRASVESLEIIDDPFLFEGAQQQVMLIVLKKGGTDRAHVFDAKLGASVSSCPLFCEEPAQLRELLDGYSTLGDLGFSIRTGRCVWNQHKAALRRQPEEGASYLLWAHNIGDGVVTWKPDHAKRPQWVVFDEPDRGPAIVVNRIIGKVGAGRLRAALVPSDVSFVGENHVNVIRHFPRIDGPVVSSENLYREVLDGLRSERAATTMRLVTGNTQLSATELTWLIPVLKK